MLYAVTTYHLNFFLTFLGLLYFHFEYLIFCSVLWTDQSCCKKSANDLASLQNHSIFGDKLDIIDGFALKFVMIFRQNISYFQTLLSFRHNHMQSKRVFLLLWVSKWCVKHTVDKKMEHGCTLKFHSTFATLRLY